ncbi:Pex14p [Nakaseomyces bracarensis]|uniref:Pex14p n=1 Tax=Nakaseomyces bracarensis TaxID=273131 RepID=UPI0038718C5C
MAVETGRKELFDSAVAFLQDAGIKDAPLSKKIEFLKSKGLQDDEVELALQEAGKGAGSGASSGAAAGVEGNVEVRRNGPGREYMYEAVPPPLPRRDWKDYFIMATATAGLLYGAYEVTRRYVVPNLLPETTSKLERDKEEIKKEFEKVDKVLMAIQDEQTEFKEKEQEKLGELDEVISELKIALKETTHTKEKMEDDFRLLKLEITSLQNSIDKFMSDNSSVKEIETLTREVQSLKNLINVAKNNSRRDAMSPEPKNSMSPGRLPGVDAIPSAADILAKMNIGTDTNKIDDSTSPKSATNEPKKSMDNMIDSSEFIPEWQRASSTNSNLDIPEWQKTASSENNKSSSNVDIPDWQNTLQGTNNDTE